MVFNDHGASAVSISVHSKEQDLSKEASVRSYQPFRYPGGKTKLAKNPTFRAMLDPMLAGADTFYEGFLGSAAVTLDVALRYPNMKFVGVDMDSTIAGFWELIGSGTEEQVQE